MNRSGKILLSLILSFSLFCLPAFADDEYGILPAMELTDELIGYVSLVDTGSDEWAQVIEYIRSNVSTSSSYACQFNTYGSIVCGINYKSYSNSNHEIKWSNYYGIIVNASTGALSYTSGSSASTLLYEGPILCMKGVPDTVGSSSGITNLNAIDFETMETLYLASTDPDGPYQQILDAIIDGTEDSGLIADDADSINSDLKDKIDEFDELEQSYINDFNDNLADIDVSGFNWDSSFLTSAAWVTTQFNELVMETPFENLITFSLIIGICLFLIGRYRGV